MSDRVFALLVSLFLTLQDVCNGFHVWTLVQYNSKDNNSVNVICQHNASADLTMGAHLLINDMNVCQTDKHNTACKGTKEGNQFNFTLKFTPEHKKHLYRCMVYKSDPLPIMTRKGEEIILPLFPEGCELGFPVTTNSCNCLDVPNECPRATLVSLLMWVLFGIMLLLCLYSLIITVLYIKLRSKISEALSITYVPMQKNRGRPQKTVKGHSADKNAEYMDMREVHHQAQPIRDMNHNSHLNPLATTI